MSVQTVVTSFANMILSANRIHKTIATEQEDTGKQYIGAKVVETFPNGSKREAIIMKIEWCPSCSVDGNWLIYVAYCDEKTFIPGSWTTREVLTLVEGE